jgi:hypothetical protein
LCTPYVFSRVGYRLTRDLELIEKIGNENVHFVTYQWLGDCFVQQKALPEEQYLTTRPVKSNVAFKSSSSFKSSGKFNVGDSFTAAPSSSSKIKREEDDQRLMKTKTKAVNNDKVFCNGIKPLLFRIEGFMLLEVSTLV